MKFDDLIAEAKKLTPAQRLVLAEEMFGNSSEVDNYGQRVIYTNITWDKSLDDYREMKKEDFIEREDMLDL